MFIYFPSISGSLKDMSCFRMADAKLTHAALDLASAARKGSVERISEMIAIRLVPGCCEGSFFPFPTCCHLFPLAFLCVGVVILSTPKYHEKKWNIAEQDKGVNKFRVQEPW